MPVTTTATGGQSSIGPISLSRSITLSPSAPVVVAAELRGTLMPAERDTGEGEAAARDAPPEAKEKAS